MDNRFSFLGPSFSFTLKMLSQVFINPMIMYQHIEYFEEFENGGNIRYSFSYYTIYWVSLGHTVTS